MTMQSLFSYMMVLACCLFFSLNISLAQSCDDGIQNGSETGTDCGGFYCPPCESQVQARLQQIITQRRLSDINAFGNFGIALDATGTRFVAMYWDRLNGNNRNVVISGHTITGQINDVHIWSNESLAAQWVDISRDGETILFSDGIGEIFVANWDGSNLREVADEIESQNPIFGNFQMTTHTGPKFNHDASSIYFFHRGNNDVTGLYEVGINQAVVDKFIFSVADMEDEFGALQSSVHNTAFRDIRISDTDEVFFLSSIHNENSEPYSIYFYKDGRLRRSVQNGPSGIQGYDVSTNGERIFYPSSNPGKIMVYDRQLDRFTELDFTHLTQDNFLDVVTNDAGTTALAKTFEWAAANSGEGFFVFNLDRRVLYPIDIGQVAVSSDHDEVELMVMSKMGDRFLFTNTTASFIRSIWVADISEPVILSNEWPRISNLTLNQNWLKLGSNIPSLDISLSAEDGVQEISDISMTYSSQARGLYRYMSGGSSFPYNELLSDDGDKAGDEFANDNVWTNVGCYEFMSDIPSSLPEAFQLRFNLISPDRITSYIQGPFYISDQAITSVADEDIEGLNIYPNPSRDVIQVDLPQTFDEPKLSLMNVLGETVSKASYQAIDRHSYLVDISSIEAGSYFILIESGQDMIVRRVYKM